MNIVKKILHFIRNHISKYYRALKAKRLKNSGFTIIANNCVGGIIYHDLGLKFLSPTINLFFSASDFLTYVENLKDFQDAELTDVTGDNSYPIGRLTTKSGIGINIDFMHYKSFEQAKSKWFERAGRINYDNVYVIFESASRLSDDLLKRYSNLNYKKILITCKENHKCQNDVCFLDLYDEDYYPGKVIEYPGTYSIRRYLDQFDYVSFLNS